MFIGCEKIERKVSGNRVYLFIFFFFFDMCFLNEIIN